MLIVAFTGLVGGVAGDRAVMALATRHQPTSSPIALASAMGGLFMGGLLALLALLILLRAGAARHRD